MLSGNRPGLCAGATDHSKASWAPKGNQLAKPALAPWQGRGNTAAPRRPKRYRMSRSSHICIPQQRHTFRCAHRGRFRTARAQRQLSHCLSREHPCKPPPPPPQRRAWSIENSVGGAEFRTLGPVATGGGKQPTFPTARAQRMVRPHRGESTHDAGMPAPENAPRMARRQAGPGHEDSLSGQQ